MPFDLTAGAHRDAIEHEEEVILQRAADDEARYPELTRVWFAFYDSPRIDPDRAGRLAAECAALAEAGVLDREHIDAARRLANFFARAAADGTWVATMSD